MVLFALFNKHVYVVMQMIVEDHHQRMAKEFLLAIILASLGIVMITVSLFCAYVLCQRNRNSSDSKTNQAAGIAFILI